MAPRLAAIVLVLAALVAGPAAAQVSATHRLPVAGEVVRGFDAGAAPYGPGHRGVDLAVVAGTPVTASAPGVVAFAGAVAGVRWVSVDHPDGTRTSVGPLERIEVTPGDLVAEGTVLGSVAAGHRGASDALHWSARRDGTYLDPMTLVDGWVPTLVDPGDWRVADPPTDLPSYAPWDGQHRWGFVPGSPRATGPGWLTPPNVNHVIGLAGFGSATGQPPFDLTHLGYDAGDVTQFSYAEGSYIASDTWRGVDVAARQLREQLRARWDSSPGQAVDLVGHSLGGVVALHYLLHYHDPADPTLPPIGHVVTLASPLQGSDIAGVLADAARDPAGTAVLAVLRRLAPDYDPLAPTVADLAPGSPVLASLDSAWQAAQQDGPAGPLATGTRVLTLGAEVDLIVPEHRSDLPDAPHAVLPGTHDGVRRSQAVRHAVRAFLAGTPVPGEAGGVGHWISYPLGWTQRLAGDAILPG